MVDAIMVVNFILALCTHQFLIVILGPEVGALSDIRNVAKCVADRHAFFLLAPVKGSGQLVRVCGRWKPYGSDP